MRVLFQIRGDYDRNVAGDSIIFQSIRRNLMNEGMEIHVSTEPNTNLFKYDLIHVFNSVRVSESYQFIKNAKIYNKKVVLTPIYWDLRSYFHQTNQLDKLKVWNRAEGKRKFMFNNADYILPHCLGEQELIEKNYGIKGACIPVSFGADMSMNEEKGNYLKAKFGIDEYVLCVGRINLQKNQLSLIKALVKDNIPIVLVGAVNDKSYLNQCLKEGKGKVILLDKISRTDLSALYKNAKVHVSPSWVEYPGLVSLEAGIAGCKVVTTEAGSTKEVFRDYVNYCHPRDIGSIRRAIMTAYETKANKDFKNFIIENYLWKDIVKAIKRIYYSII